MSLPLIQCLESYGLVDEISTYRFFKKAKRKELRDLRDAIVSARADDRDTLEGLPPSIFNFCASSSLRGDAGCSEPRCRLRKISVLERFATLYSDHLVLPLHLGESSDHPNPTLLMGSILIVNRLRPAIDAGLITPVPDTVCMCPACVKEKYDDADSVFSRLVDAFAERYIPEVEITYLGQNRQSEIVLRMDGPATILGDTLVRKAFAEIPAWLENVSLSPGDVLSEDLIRSSGMVHDLYSGSLFQCTVQDYYAEEFSCSYLSDNAKEAELLVALGTGKLDEQVQTAYEVTTAMSHEIPMFADVSLSSLTNLRKAMPDAFAAYRNGVNAAMKELKGTSVSNASLAKEFISRRPASQGRCTEGSREVIREASVPKCLDRAGDSCHHCRFWPCNRFAHSNE